MVLQGGRLIHDVQLHLDMVLVQDEQMLVVSFRTTSSLMLSLMLLLLQLEVDVGIAGADRVAETDTVTTHAGLRCRNHQRHQGIPLCRQLIWSGRLVSRALLLQ